MVADVHRRCLAAIGALTFLALAACASPPRQVTAQVSLTTPVAELSTALSWPDGYNQPTRLVADPDSAGVWWWSTSAGGSALFHYVPDSGIRIEPMDSVAGALPFTPDYGLAVTATQVVLGTQREIVSVNRANDKLTRWNLPEPADARASTDSDLPSQILALAATNATVAVSVRDEPAIRILDEKTGGSLNCRFPIMPRPAILPSTVRVASRRVCSPSNQRLDRTARVYRRVRFCSALIWRPFNKSRRTRNGSRPPETTSR